MEVTFLSLTLTLTHFCLCLDHASLLIGVLCIFVWVVDQGTLSPKTYISSLGVTSRLLLFSVSQLQIL